MYRNLYIDPHDKCRWFYYKWEEFSTRELATKYASRLMDFRTKYRKTIKLPENITTITENLLIYVDQSLFQ